MMEGPPTNYHLPDSQVDQRRSFAEVSQATPGNIAQLSPNVYDPNNYMETYRYHPAYNDLHSKWRDPKDLDRYDLNIALSELRNMVQNLNPNRISDVVVYNASSRSNSEWSSYGFTYTDKKGNSFRYFFNLGRIYHSNDPNSPESQWHQAAEEMTTILKSRNPEQSVGSRAAVEAGRFLNVLRKNQLNNQSNPANTSPKTQIPTPSQTIPSKTIPNPPKAENRAPKPNGNYILRNDGTSFQFEVLNN